MHLYKYKYIYYYICNYIYIICGSADIIIIAYFTENEVPQYLPIKNERFPELLTII